MFQLSMEQALMIKVRKEKRYNHVCINSLVNNPFLEGVTISDLQRQASALGMLISLICRV